MYTAPGLPALVAVAGRKRAGKGTAAAWLMERHGYELVKFADPLKAMLRTFFQHWRLDAATIERLIEGDLKEVSLPVPTTEGMAPCLSQVKMSGRSPRWAMQTLGTEWRDLISPTLWVDMAEARIRGILESGRRVVIDDMRFMHEADRISGMGGMLLKVTNCRLPPAVDLHVSEQDLPDSMFSHIVPNDGTFEEFHALLEHAIPD